MSYCVGEGTQSHGKGLRSIASRSNLPPNVVYFVVSPLLSLSCLSKMNPFHLCGWLMVDE